MNCKYSFTFEHPMCAALMCFCITRTILYPYIYIYIARERERERERETSRKNDWHVTIFSKRIDKVDKERNLTLVSIWANPIPSHISLYNDMKGLIQWLECSPIVRDTGFNPRSSHTIDSEKWYLMSPCLFWEV